MVALEEGHLVEPDKGGELDMKGLAIRKVNTNSKAREIFEEILEEDILKSEKINIAKIVKKYKKFEDDIFTSLRSGSAEYGAPGKANSAESYKDPFRIGPFRGAILWNKLFPSNEIVFPSRVIVLRLNMKSIEEVYEHVEDEHVLSVLEEAFEDENMLVGGMINSISMPEGTREIPDFLVPFVDADHIVNSTIRPGLIMLESLAIRLVTSSSASYPSTIVTL